jgi:hypothetical protein
MVKEKVNQEMLHIIIGEFFYFLEDGILDSPNSFPVLITCTKFMEELKEKGIDSSLDMLEPKIIEKISKEICDYFLR